MDIKVVIIISISFLYGFFEVFMNLRQRSRGGVAASGDKGSLWWLYGLITLGYSLSSSIGATKIGRMPAWDIFFAIGMTLIALKDKSFIRDFFAFCKEVFSSRHC